MSRRIDILPQCLFPGTRWCRAIFEVDDDSVTVCGRCADLLDLTVEEVVGAHLERLAESDEVMVEDAGPAGEVVREGPVADPADVRDLGDGPVLFPHEPA